MDNPYKTPGDRNNGVYFTLCLFSSFGEEGPSGKFEESEAAEGHYT